MNDFVINDDDKFFINGQESELHKIVCKITKGFQKKHKLVSKITM